MFCCALHATRTTPRVTPSYRVGYGRAEGQEKTACNCPLVGVFFKIFPRNFEKDREHVQTVFGFVASNSNKLDSIRFFSSVNSFQKNIENGNNDHEDKTEVNHHGAKVHQEDAERVIGHVSLLYTVGGFDGTGKSHNFRVKTFDWVLVSNCKHLVRRQRLALWWGCVQFCANR